MIYRSLYFVHLSALFAFLLVHGTSVWTSLWLKKETNPAVARALLHLSAKSYPFMYASVLLILGSGLAMAFLGSWWGHVWIWAGLAVFIAALAAMGFLVGNYRQARAAEPGDDHIVLAQLKLTRPRLLLGIGVGSLLVLLWLMVFKPF